MKIIDNSHLNNFFQNSQNWSNICHRNENLPRVSKTGFFLSPKILEYIAVAIQISIIIKFELKNWKNEEFWDFFQKFLKFWKIKSKCDQPSFERSCHTKKVNNKVIQPKKNAKKSKFVTKKDKISTKRKNKVDHPKGKNTQSFSHSHLNSNAISLFKMKNKRILPKMKKKSQNFTLNWFQKHKNMSEKIENKSFFCLQNGRNQWKFEFFEKKDMDLKVTTFWIFSGSWVIPLKVFDDKEKVHNRSESQFLILRKKYDFGVLNEKTKKNSEKNYFSCRFSSKKLMQINWSKCKDNGWELSFLFYSQTLYQYVLIFRNSKIILNNGI